MLRTGFYVEETVFAREKREIGVNRIKRLSGSSGDLMLRGLGIMSFCAALVVVVFFSLDYAANLLFGFPILAGRVADSLPIFDSDDGSGFPLASILSDIVYLMFNDPLVLTVLTGVVLLVYPIGRMAWFLCYVDLRIRRDLWDVELEFARHASRLAEEQ
jgi:hypothetical protein